MSTTRRDFITTGAAAAAGLVLPARAGPSFTRIVESTEQRPPATLAGRPVVVASDNALRGVKIAYDMLAKGADPLDAAIAGANIQELDPEDQSVGLGGLPNADGVVQLDASVMHGPTRRAGSVASLEDIAKPSAPPRSSRRPSSFPSHQRAAGSHLYFDERGVPFSYGTVNINAVTASGDNASCTSTSGLSWKIPGRIGDSPIIGAGQYCDNEVGAAGSTGRGEANIKVCGAFLAVEFMRQGMTPEGALLKVMERVIAMTEKRLLNERGRPYFDLEYYAVNKKGEVAGATCYEGGSYAVCDAQGARSVKMAYLYKRAERPTGKPISGTLVPP